MIATRLARALLEIEAVRFDASNPRTFKSGIISPVYVDNRAIPYHPIQWRAAIEAFGEIIQQEKLEYDLLAGIAVGGVPHSAALAYHLQRPSVIVRKVAKDYGLKNRVEGGSVDDKHVLLVEDLVTTGGSSISGVQALREVGATVEHALAIVSYGFSVSTAAFKVAGVRLHTLTDFPTVLQEGLATGYFTLANVKIIQDWLDDPFGWAERHDPT